MRFKQLSFVVLLILAALLVVGCTQYVSDVPPELRPTALAGQATYYDQTKVEACKKDPSCWTKFLSCYKPKCVDIKATGTPAEWGECVNGCLPSGSGESKLDCKQFGNPTLSSTMNGDSFCTNQGYDACIDGTFIARIQYNDGHYSLFTMPFFCEYPSVFFGPDLVHENLPVTKNMPDTNYTINDPDLVVTCCKIY